jgi:hypothetical protein
MLQNGITMKEARIARTTTFPRAFAHPEQYYRAPLVPRVHEEATNKPKGWGIIKEEQLGCLTLAAMLHEAEGLSPEAKRVIRGLAAQALYATASFDFMGGINVDPVRHVSGVEPSYRNVKVPRLDLDRTTTGDRELSVIDRLVYQAEVVYPGILRGIEGGGRYVDSKLKTNARVLGACALDLRVMPLTELYIPGAVEMQDCVASAANELKVAVAYSTQEDGVTPSVRQAIRRSSPLMLGFVGHPQGEVSDLALAMCSEL